MSTERSERSRRNTGLLITLSLIGYFVIFVILFYLLPVFTSA